jgi:hypothetical protein
MQRFRESDQTVPSNCTLIYWDDKGVQEPEHIISLGLVGSYKSISDVVTPGYRKLRRSGAIIMSPATITSKEYKASGGYWAGASPTWGSETVSGNIASMVAVNHAGAVSGSDQQRCRDLALVRAYAAMNASPVMGGEIVSDLSKTVSMLRHPFKSAISLIGQMMDFKGKRFKRNIDRLTGVQVNAQAWLEFRYGWKPLLMDGIEIMKQCNNIVNRSNGGFRVARGSSTVTRIGTGSYDMQVGGGGVFRAFGTGGGADKFSSHAGVLYRTLPSSIGGEVSQALGLTARAIPATLWEIMPYSFVVDWFSNVGPWLEALTPRSDITVLSSWQSDVRETIEEIHGGTIQRVISGTLFTGSVGSRSVKTTTLNRYVNPTLSLTPSLTVKPLSMKQWTDAVALSSGKVIQGLRSFRH